MFVNNKLTPLELNVLEVAIDHMVEHLNDILDTDISSPAASNSLVSSAAAELAPVILKYLAIFYS